MDTKLSTYIDELIQLLYSDCKDDVANYFASVKDDLLSGHSVKERDALSRLKTGGKICDYASFSKKEDEIYTTIQAICSDKLKE